MMKTGIMNTAYGANASNPSGYVTMKSHGYDFTDFDGFARTSQPAFTGTVDEAIAIAKAERAAAEAAGITVEQVHGPWPTDDTNPEGQAKKLKDMKRAILLTQYMGARYLIIHPDMPYGWEREDDPQTAWDNTERLFRELLPLAKEAGVILCIENMPMTAHALSTVDRMMQFVEMMDDDNLMMCFDTGHAAVFHHNVGDCVRRIGKKLATLHVHDNDGTRDQHRLPYEGIIDWDGFRRTLTEIGFGGVMNLETKIPNTMPEPAKTEAQKALSTLTKILAEPLQ